MRYACLAMVIILFLSDATLCSADALLGKLMYKVLTVEERIDNLETQFQSALDRLSDKLDERHEPFSTKKNPSMCNEVSDMKETKQNTVAEIIESQYTVLKTFVQTFVRKEKKVLFEAKRQIANQALQRTTELEKQDRKVHGLSEKIADVESRATTQGQQLSDHTNQLSTTQRKLDVYQSLCSSVGDRVAALENKTGTFVSFSVLLSSKLRNTSAETIIKFDVIIDNYGGHYSSSTGKFTAPVRGMYLFIFYIASNSKGTIKIAHVGLFVDEIFVKAAAIADSSCGDIDATGGNAVILRLDREQEVYVKTYDFPDEHDVWPWKTSFSGTLLHAE